LDARLTTLLYKKITVAKSKEVKTVSNLAVSSKEGYGSKRFVSPMMMVIYAFGVLHFPHFISHQK
jgi:sporulation protein YlmC with PRC-barrel domain